jgi:hypothetical protein
MFENIFSLKPAWIFVIYLLLDALCIGMGMGVPIFCLALLQAGSW